MNIKKQINIPVLLSVVLVMLIYYFVGGDGKLQPANYPIEDADIVVHYIDVGQGDSELIQLPDGSNMLIDGGTNGSTKQLINYLSALGVEKINYLVATHPHEDHIGGLDTVVDTFEIGQIYMPKVSHTTKSYKNLLKAISDKNLSIITAAAGKSIIDNEDLKIELLAPNSNEYEDLNDYSVVVKMTFKEKSFLFTGDATEISENEMLSKGYSLSSDVLKVGHHGSLTSSSSEFLSAVNPTYAIISCGQDNSYNHPNKKIVSRLGDKKINIYRTDLNGTVKVYTDGVSINISTEK